ncbi:mechanosensitive ion channel family protein [Halovenus salina]|uniref:Mechanosensitive ion channel family protein n=1 Tax=Halovenus salina TaxID=1510225 RepID=A0ABD5W4P7_9EURY|nr:mechanosensitive ion channel family protein [Halovenus salina]
MTLTVVTLPLVSLSDVQTFLEELQTTEGRVAVSAVALIALVAVALFVAPYIVHTLGYAVRDRLLNDQMVSLVDTVSAYIPTTLGRLVLRLVQLGISFLALVSLLVVWGLVDAAVTVVQLTGLSLPFLVSVTVTIGIFFGAYIAMGLFNDLIDQFGQEADHVTDHQQEILLRLSHLGVLAFAITAVLTLWGINLSGLLVGAGFLGIVVGMAARQTLGAMIAGFVLMFSRPFTVGDWIEVGDEDGIVTNITIMNTRLKNFDGEAIVIPNDIVSNSAITNRTSQGHLRTRLDVGIDYAADPERAQEIAQAVMEDLDAVANAPPPQVVSKAFGDSAIVLELRFWVDRPTPQHRWHAVESVVHGVKEAFEDAGIKIPYPQRELSGRAETGGFRVQDPIPEEAVEAPATRPEE